MAIKIFWAPRIEEGKAADGSPLYWPQLYATSVVAEPVPTAPHRANNSSKSRDESTAFRTRDQAVAELANTLNDRAQDGEEIRWENTNYLTRKEAIDAIRANPVTDPYP